MNNWYEIFIENNHIITKNRSRNFRKFTATEDVSYSSHTSRSSFRSESVTQKTNHCGRSTSSEIISVNKRKFLYI